ncbi:hypothetical protein DFJ74DRAFT_463228 [Hyaloraphidium curvatum]|nr:hypothetical protein DFJ74DRAFT_463228 [Hyaloraphidium curvatum]
MSSSTNKRPPPPPPPKPPTAGGGSPTGKRNPPPPPPGPRPTYVPMDTMASSPTSSSDEPILYPGEEPVVTAPAVTAPPVTKRPPPPPPPVANPVVASSPASYTPTTAYGSYGSTGTTPLAPAADTALAYSSSNASRTTTASTAATLVSTAEPKDPYKSAYIDLEGPTDPLSSGTGKPKKQQKKWLGLYWWIWLIIGSVAALALAIGIAVAVVNSKNAQQSAAAGVGSGAGATTGIVQATTDAAASSSAVAATTTRATSAASPVATSPAVSSAAATSAAPSRTTALATTPLAVTSASRTALGTTSALATGTTSALATGTTSALATGTRALAPPTIATVTPTDFVAPLVLGPRAFPTARAVADDGTKWTVEVGEYGLVPNNFGELDDFLHTVPDSFTPALPSSNPQPGQSHFFIYSESSNHRSVGTGPFPENQTLFAPSRPGGWSQIIFGGRNESSPLPTNGGAWLMAVARHPIKGGSNLVGFYHAQDHIFGDPARGNATITDAAGEAWKFVGVAYSPDDGVTWTDGGIILSSVVPKPSVPTWGGLGDFGAVWDWRAQHWKIYFKEQQKIGVAISTDPDARNGTWYKWRWMGSNLAEPDVSDWPLGQKEPPGPEWNSPGLGGVYTGLPGMTDVPGANPGCHWNTYLESWVCIWNSWDTTEPGIVPRSLYIASSLDGLHWSEPRLLVGPKCPTSKAWHATVISEEGGSEFAGKRARLYHSDCWVADTGVGRFRDGREWVARDIEFTRTDE